jgi:exosortase K
MSSMICAKANWIYFLKMAAVIVVAAVLKYFYSNASVNELKWILAPTAFLVEWTTWSRFTFESYAGYMNSDHTFLIAASCSGVNFLIAAFLMLSLSRLWHGRSESVRWSFLPKAALLAYLATVVANTVRISTAMQMQGLDFDWLDAEELHRLEGIVVYFGSLWLLFVLTEPRGSLHHGKARNLLRRATWPLLVYYAVTLGIPFANGAFRQGNGFWKHSIFVFVIPVLLIMTTAALRVIKQRSNWITRFFLVSALFSVIADN